MTEVSSSQESLPLSQETFFSLWNVIPENIKDEFLNQNVASFFTENFSQEHMIENKSQTNPFSGSFTQSNAVENHECAQFEPVVSQGAEVAKVSRPAQSSLPPMEDFPGSYDFTVLPPSTENPSKASPYVYSSIIKKLYIRKDSACPFYFSTNEPLVNFDIRAVLVFSAPENVPDVVIRCYDHAFADKEKGDGLADHLVQCESQQATYYTDEYSKRRSVLVPYENPPAGQHYTTYLYKFKCFTSCSGGPNRRPFSVLFTLEHKGMVVGRRRIDLKICSGPFRDRRLDEKKVGADGENVEEVSLKQSVGDKSNDTAKTGKAPLKRKHNENLDTEKWYTIKVPHKECYELLKAVKKYYYINKCIQENTSWKPTPRDIGRLLKTTSSSSEDEKLV